MREQLLRDGLQPRTVSPTTLRADQRTRGDALLEMQQVLEGERLNEPTAYGSTVIRNPKDVTSNSDWDYREKRNEQAKAQVAANAALEADALRRMSPADRASYLAVKARLSDGQDVVAVLSLQKLLFSGALPGAQDGVNHGRLLDHLASVADGTAQLAPGVSRDGLLQSLVQELATPSAIDQGPKGTCGPTTLLIELAMKNPAEYARLALGLASPSGQVTMVGGQTLTREPGTEADDGSGRSTTQRLLAPALQEAAKPEAYDNASDAGWGTWGKDLAALHQQLFGTSEVVKTAETPAQRQAVTDAVMREARLGHQTQLILDVGGSLHWVLVVGVEKKDGKEYLKVINPYGQVELISPEEVARRTKGANLPPDAVARTS
ncbi:MAG: hypothetical protein K1X89_28650 [Myxococcaceae bacterium]|nr:hypothetical protein [Myxococcaceae bacterium]